MAKKISNPLIPNTGAKSYPVGEQHQSPGSHPDHTAVPVSGGNTNIQHVPNRGKFSVNDHRIARSTPRHSPTEE
jgi:hypothetical protein